MPETVHNALAERLDDTEIEIIKGLCCGLQLKEIAKVLHLGEASVRNKAVITYARLGARSATEACYLWGKHESHI